MWLFHKSGNLDYNLHAPMTNNEEIKYTIQYSDRRSLLRQIIQLARLTCKAYFTIIFEEGEKHLVLVFPNVDVEDL